MFQTTNQISMFFKYFQMSIGTIDHGNTAFLGIIIGSSSATNIPLFFGKEFVKNIMETHGILETKRVICVLLTNVCYFCLFQRQKKNVDHSQSWASHLVHYVTLPTSPGKLDHEILVDQTSTIFVTRSRHTFRVLDFWFSGKPPVRDKASGSQVPKKVLLGAFGFNLSKQDMILLCVYRYS